jgi:hypothetical protein
MTVDLERPTIFAFTAVKNEFEAYGGLSRL